MEYTLRSEILIDLILQHIYIYFLHFLIRYRNTQIYYIFSYFLNQIRYVFNYIFIEFFPNSLFQLSFSQLIFLFLFCFHFHITDIFDIIYRKIELRKAILAFRFDSFVNDRFHREIHSGRESQVTRRLTNLFISITQLQLYDIRQQLSSVERWKHTCMSNL